MMVVGRGFGFGEGAFQFWGVLEKGVEQNVVEGWKGALWYLHLCVLSVRLIFFFSLFPSCLFVSLYLLS